jgi:enoyl-CoA hydratase
MACDLIIAAETANFGQPETSVGIIPGAGGTQRLVRAIGKAKAMDVILTGRTLDAREAERAGLVARVVAPEACLSEAQAVAASICARAPIAQRLARDAVDRAADMGLADGLAYERKALYLAFASEDAREGLTAFTERRPPRWSWT